MFNRFFGEFDTNQDGVISKGEMARFFKKFFGDQRTSERPSP
jgi:Ca2+-binding EF-hand superfamily protein